MSSPLSAFTAVPNPQMLAFMGTQSFIMMYQAGEGWQYGKRKQSAMSNEEFNKQTPLSIMDRQRTELIKALPSIADSMNAMTPLIKTIVTQYGDFVSAAIKATPEAITNATEGFQFPFTADASHGSGPPNQQTNKQSSNLNLDALLLQLTNLTLSIIKGGIGNVPGKQTGGYIETEQQRILADELARGTIITDEKAFIDIDKQIPPTSIIQKRTTSTGAVNIPYQPSVDQLRRQQISESGLSPLAYQSRQTFQTNIIKAKDALAVVEKAAATQAARYGFGSSYHKAALEKSGPLIKKLSALRIKYHQVYGVYI